MTGFDRTEHWDNVYATKDEVACRDTHILQLIDA